MNTQMEQKLRKNRAVPDTFNVVYRRMRLHFSISIEEACVMDTVHNMSLKQYNDYPAGWCYASKGYFSRFLGMNRVSIQRMVKRLVEKGLLIKGTSTSLRVVPLRVCNSWVEKVKVSSNMKEVYSNINHLPRMELDLSCGEYCILDALCWLKEYKTFVWHRGTKRWLADRLCLPYSTFTNLFQRMYTRGFLKKVEQYEELNGDMYAFDVVEDFRYIISEAIRRDEMSLEKAIKSVRANAYTNARWVSCDTNRITLRV